MIPIHVAPPTEGVVLRYGGTLFIRQRNNGGVMPPFCSLTLLRTELRIQEVRVANPAVIHVPLDRLEQEFWKQKPQRTFELTGPPSNVMIEIIDLETQPAPRMLLEASDGYELVAYEQIPEGHMYVQ